MVKEFEAVEKPSPGASTFNTSRVNSEFPTITWMNKSITEFDPLGSKKSKNLFLTRNNSKLKPI